MSALVDYDLELRLLSAALSRDVRKWFVSTQNMRTTEVAESAHAVLPYLIDTYGSSAGFSASNYLFQQWSQSGDSAYTRLPFLNPVTPYNPAQLGESIDWALQTKKGGPAVEANRVGLLERTEGMASRYVLSHARQTILRGVETAQTGYARIPEPGACSFCMMLATRGAVYSKDMAVLTYEGTRYHDNCRCSAVQVIPKTKNPGRELANTIFIRDEHTGLPRRARDVSSGEKWLVEAA